MDDFRTQKTCTADLGWIRLNLGLESRGEFFDISMSTRKKAG